MVKSDPLSRRAVRDIYLGEIRRQYKTYMNNPIPFYVKQIKEIYAAYRAAGGSEMLEDILMLVVHEEMKLEAEALGKRLDERRAIRGE